MRQVKFSKLLNKSYNRMTFILFEPFSVKKWLWLLLIVYLSGATGSGPNISGNYSPGVKDEASKVTRPHDAHAPNTEMVLDTYTGQYVEKEAAAEYIEEEKIVSEGNALKKITQGVPGWVIMIVGILGLLVLALMIFFTWVMSRFKFVWFNSIVNNVTAIKEPFNKYRLPGNSLFKFYLILGIGSILIFVMFAYWAYRMLVSAGAFEEGFEWSFAFFAQNFGVISIALVIFTIIVSVILVFIEHFVVTIMAMDQCLFMPAIRKFLGIYKENQKDFWLYILILVGLGILSAVIVGIIILITGIALLVTGGVLFGIPYLLIAVLLKLKWLFIVFAIVMAIPFLIASLLLVMSVGLPVYVFFRSFSLYFLSSLNCGYEPLALEVS